MNCIELEHWLFDDLDAGGETLPDDLQRHLAECAGCRDLVAGRERLRRGLAEWRMVSERSAVPAAVIVSRLRGTQAPLNDELEWAGRSAGRESGVGRVAVGNRGPELERRTARGLCRARWSLAWGGVAMAACIGMIASTLTGPEGFWKPSGPGNVAVRPSVSPAPVTGMSGSPIIAPGNDRVNAAVNPRRAADEVAEGDVKRFVRTAGDAYLELARETAGTLEDAVALLVPSVPALREEEVLPAWPVSPVPPNDWGRGLTPVGESLEKALDFLWLTESDSAT